MMGLKEEKRNVSTYDKRQSKYLVSVEKDNSLYRWLDGFEVPVPCTREFRARELVYHDLWRKGYYLTSGLQFGCTYLAYEGKDKNVVSIFEKRRAFSAMPWVCFQVKKSLVVAIVASDSHQPQYIKFDWFKPYTEERE
ncbi:unnamed protein product [Angiostrongylus costaricensis]|uniref:tRNA-intron lyase n=1 Tax=Angiostrongylus costaricensis TaxID=334426 RepID=A0A0R3PSK9_ANGCS|nr:unnamed protein product [Angiostrongylus costaricensis]